MTGGCVIVPESDPIKKKGYKRTATTSTSLKKGFINNSLEGNKIETRSSKQLMRGHRKSGRREIRLSKYGQVSYQKNIHSFESNNVVLLLNVSIQLIL